jgi:hypothetical protein
MTQDFSGHPLSNGSKETGMPVNKPGSYPGKLIDWAITETKDGSPQVVCMFEYLQDGKPLRLNWFGSFKEKAYERTIEALRFLGLQGVDLSILADGAMGKGLTKDKVADIVVEVRPNLTGKLVAGIAWVNNPHEANIPKKVSRDRAAQLLEVHSLKLSSIQGLPVSQPSSATAQDGLLF